jgi:phosphoribosylformylglycinamidine synthase
MRFGIIVFPGSNCDRDCQYVVEKVIGASVSLIWHNETSLSGLDVVVLPGGFSFGDYLRTGAIARISPIMNALAKFAADGGKVLGICNGFQILTEAGLLPGVLLRNRSLKFICRSVHIRVENNQTPFTSLYQKGTVLSMPIAHAEGNYYIESEQLDTLKNNGQIVFRYCNENGFSDREEGANPNGSLDNIAGICNKEGTVLGMMPHPERAADPLLNAIDGILLFQSLTRRSQQVVST